MDRNPLYTKERATFHFQKIEKYYKQEAYQQALEEIEINRDLLGAALNMGQQVTLTKILTNSLVNTMYDVFLVEGNLARFDQLYTAYKTHLELHASPNSYGDLTKFFQEKEKSTEFKSKSQTIGKFVTPDESVYVDPIREEVSVLKSESKDQKSIDIEADFLASIGSPLFAPQNAVLEIEKEKKDKQELIPKENNIDDLFEVKTNSTQKSPVVSEFSVETINISQEKTKTKTKTKSNQKPEAKTTLEPKKISEKKPSDKKAPDKQKSKSNTKKKKRRRLSTFGIIVVSLTAALVLFGGYYVYSSGVISNLFNSQDTTLEEGTSTPEPTPAPLPEPVPEPAPEPEPEPEPAISYLLPSDTLLLTDSDLDGMTSKDIRLAVNEMFARRGWNFGFSGGNYDYFMTQDWYEPDQNMTSPSQAESQFTSIERTNLQFLLNYEKNL